MQFDKKVNQINLEDDSINNHDLLCDKSYLRTTGPFGIILDNIYNDVLFIFGININGPRSPPNIEVLKNRVECIKESIDLSNSEIGQKNQKLIRNLEFMLNHPEKAEKELNRPRYILNN